MSPPELTGNTPVTNVLQPVQVGLVKTLRNKLQIAILKCLNRSLCHLIHFYKPLRFDHWLYRCLAAVMCSYGMCMIDNFYQKSLCIQVCNHGFSCLISVHACIFTAFFIDGGIIIHDVDFFQIVAFSYLKVIRVVRRCNFYTTSSKFFVYIRICNYRNLSVCQRQFQHFSNQMLISLIIRIYRYCSISKQSLRTCRRDLYKFIFASHDRIFDVPEMTSLIHMLYLCIGNRSLAYRTPVDDSGSFVNITFFV